MKYFTAKEARAIMDHSDITLCINWDINPALAEAQALHEKIKTDRCCRDEPFLAAVCGFVLGRATGIREERQRRKGSKV